jgi:hypothetical protein
MAVRLGLVVSCCGAEGSSRGGRKLDTDLVNFFLRRRELTE